MRQLVEGERRSAPAPAAPPARPGAPRLGHDVESTSDSLGHAGGDELAILLPQANRERACRVAEAIAKAIGERVLITAGHKLRTTASLGIATIESGDAPTRVLLRADQAL